MFKRKHPKVRISLNNGESVFEAEGSPEFMERMLQSFKSIILWDNGFGEGTEYGEALVTQEEMNNAIASTVDDLKKAVDRKIHDELALAKKDVTIQPPTSEEKEALIEVASTNGNLPHPIPSDLENDPVRAFAIADEMRDGNASLSTICKELDRAGLGNAKNQPYSEASISWMLKHPPSAIDTVEEQEDDDVAEVVKPPYGMTAEDLKPKYEFDPIRH